MRPLLMGALLASFAALPAKAQNFTGTYTTPNDRGEAVTHPQFHGMYFQAELEGTGLLLTLVGVDANNQPDFNQIQQITFQCQSPTGGFAAEGLAADSAADSGSGAQSTDDAWVGTWTGGSLILDLQGGDGRYSGTAQIDGTHYPMTARGAATGISGTYEYEGQHLPWLAQLQGETMVLYAGGDAFHLRKSGGTEAADQASAAPGREALARLSPQGLEWHRYLSAKRLTQTSSYYSGPGIEGGAGGGMSNRRTMDVCSDGRFFYSESGQLGISGDGVWGSAGGSEAQRGTWRIIEQGGLIGIEFRWQDGSVTQHRLDYQQNRTMIDGERTFVTQDNASCPQRGQTMELEKSADGKCGRTG